jgi:hypothetical protein
MLACGVRGIVRCDELPAMALIFPCQVFECWIIKQEESRRKRTDHSRRVATLREGNALHLATL